MNERKIEGKEKSKTSKRLLASGVLLASLLGGQAFAVSLGQGFPQAVRQSVIVNEKLQEAKQDTLFLATKLETASGGFLQKPLKSIGGLTFETQYSTGFNLTLSANLRQSFLNNYRARYYDPIMGRFMSVDPLGFVDSLNLYQAFGNNPINFTDPMGLYGIDFHYYVINFLVRAKGWKKETAHTIASYSQYVDDNAQTDSVSSSLKLQFANSARFHFPGSTEYSTTIRDDLETRNRLERYIEDFKSNAFGADIRMGTELHVYADSWAHESFTAYRSQLNARTNSLRPYIGHADTGWGGHEPDLIPLNKESSQKALAAAEHIYNVFPAGPEKALGWLDVHDCLLWAFNVPDKPFNNREAYTNYVIFMMRFLLQQKFNDFNVSYDINEMTKIDQFIDWSLGF